MLNHPAAKDVLKDDPADNSDNSGEEAEADEGLLLIQAALEAGDEEALAEALANGGMDALQMALESGALPESVKKTLEKQGLLQALEKGDIKALTEGGLMGELKAGGMLEALQDGTVTQTLKAKRRGRGGGKARGRRARGGKMKPGMRCAPLGRGGASDEEPSPENISAAEEFVYCKKCRPAWFPNTCVRCGKPVDGTFASTMGAVATLINGTKNEKSDELRDILQKSKDLDEQHMKQKTEVLSTTYAVLKSWCLSFDIPDTQAVRPAPRQLFNRQSPPRLGPPRTGSPQPRSPPRRFAAIATSEYDAPRPVHSAVAGILDSRSSRFPSPPKFALAKPKAPGVTNSQPDLSGAYTGIMLSKPQPQRHLHTQSLQWVASNNMGDGRRTRLPMELGTAEQLQGTKLVTQEQLPGAKPGWLEPSGSTPTSPPGTKQPQFGKYPHPVPRPPVMGSPLADLQTSGKPWHPVAGSLPSLLTAEQQLSDAQDTVSELSMAPRGTPTGYTGAPEGAVSRPMCLGDSPMARLGTSEGNTPIKTLSFMSFPDGPIARPLGLTDTAPLVRAVGSFTEGSPGAFKPFALPEGSEALRIGPSDSMRVNAPESIRNSAPDSIRINDSILTRGDSLRVGAPDSGRVHVQDTVRNGLADHLKLVASSDATRVAALDSMRVGGVGLGGFDVPKNGLNPLPNMRLPHAQGSPVNGVNFPTKSASNLSISSTTKSKEPAASVKTTSISLKTEAVPTAGNTRSHKVTVVVSGQRYDGPDKKKL